MKTAFTSAICLTLFSISASSFAQSYAGYPDIPATGAAFGTQLMDYNEGPGVTPPSNDPNSAIGEPNNTLVSLGRLGSVTLSTKPMALKGNGTTDADFYIYEGGQYESWDVYVSNDNTNWIKVPPISTATNSTGSVVGYDIDTASTTGSYSYFKIVDTSNSSGTSSAGADIDSVLLVGADYAGGGEIVDTDSLDGTVFNLEKDKSTGAVDVKKISKDGVVKHIMFSTDDSLEPVALSVQGDYDNNGEKDINALVIRKSDNVPLNIIKDQQGSEIKTIDNSVIN